LIQIIQGDESVVSIKRWFSNIKKFTSDEDIAIIHGDDDIMLPNSLLYRYQEAIKCNKTVFIGSALWSAYFLKSKSGIFIDGLIQPYDSPNTIKFESASGNELLKFPLPFISVYTYKINQKFWTVFDTALSWSDALPYEPKIKYPYVPFYIGLAAQYQNELAVANANLVIRGQLFQLRQLLPPLTVTEYANGGIISLCGLAVLNNETLKRNSDFDSIRNNHRELTKKYVLLSLSRRDGVSLPDLFKLYKLSKAKFRFNEFSITIILMNFRYLFDNIFFTTNLKRWFTGWGNETSFKLFWQNWEKRNQHST